ncbi:type II toxin-antitoxin system VapC family toxin [Thiothrix subterranea]|uniref:Ribonuclease VapC n=1 Tax=Thiothrix subterranea TaxID=2735563 RepID=A0AA51MM88_9GAMM|nr:type II toxin-antitoxin system VapC family toxin [Thiothrix subterranea]MDQ5770747.1 type II toxin-antitoxin system VapC family toxin [Thiothrix subterranea]WML85631.1 type II toxin-antitoxin system VapC family toxin [Thiothrix subterranea]
MVIDTSAIIAILLGEPEAEALSKAILDDPKRLMSAFSLLECSIVIESRKGEAGGRELDLLLYRLQVEIVDMNEEQTQLARAGWRQFGKGRHRAALNIGDCCSYALAKYTGEPLLFKGDDFNHSDIPYVTL